MNKTKSNLIEEKNTTILKLTLILDKLFTVLDDFRQNLSQFQKSCNCIENLKNKFNFTELEDDYKSIIDEYNENKAKIDEELGITCDYIQETSTQPTEQSTTTPAVTVRRLKTKEIFNCEYEDCDYKTWCMSSMRKHVNYLHLNKSKIKCKDCDHQCWGSHRLKQHIKTTHSKSYACPYDDCNSAYFSEWNIQKHIALVHKNKSKLSCNECQFKCWQITKLRAHQMEVHNRIFACLLNKRTPNKKKNKSSVDGINSYECIECGHRYRRKAQLSNHIKWVHKIVNESQYFQNVVYKFPYKRVFHTKRTRIASRHKQCVICNVLFYSLEEWRRHINTCHPNNFKNRYIDSHYLRKNLNTISLENSSVDSDDNNSLNMDQTIDLRADIETFNADLKCSLSSNELIRTQINGTLVSITEDNPSDGNSDKRDHNFVFGSNLVNKLREQTLIKSEHLFSNEPQLVSNNSELRTSNCQTNNFFQMLPKLKIHRRRIYKEMVRCDECDYKTDRKMNLSVHKKRIHSRRNYKCLHCGLTFRCFDQLNKHSSICVNVFVCDRKSCFFQTTDSLVFEEHKKNHSSDMIIRLSDNKNNYNIACEVVLTESNAVDKGLIELQGESQTLKPSSEEVIERHQTSDAQQIDNNSQKDKDLENISNQMPVRNDNNCQTILFVEFTPLEPLNSTTKTSTESVVIKCEPQEVEPLMEEEIIDRNETSITPEINSQPKQDMNFDNICNELLERSADNCQQINSSDIFRSNFVFETEVEKLDSLLEERPTIKPKENLFVTKISNLNQLTNELTNSCPHNSSENVTQVVTDDEMEDNNNKSILPSLKFNFKSQSKLVKRRSTRPLRKRVNNSNKSQRNCKNSENNDKKTNEFKYCCDKCEYKTPELHSYRVHMSRHQIYNCPHCSTVCGDFNEMREHRINFHDSRVEQQFKCDLNDCRFECNDSHVFSEHKRNHLNENIDKIITEFQFGIKRVEIKTEIEEENTVFVDAEQFLAQNTVHTLPISGASNDTTDSSDNLLNCSSNLLKISPSIECQSSSGTGKRLRGLNSAREPIRLPSKSTKKISELFKK